MYCLFVSERFLLSIAVDYWRLWLVMNINDSKKFPTYPRTIPQTPHNMKEFLNHLRVKGDAGSMFLGYVGVVIQNDTSIEKIFLHKAIRNLCIKKCANHRRKSIQSYCQKNRQGVLHFPPPWALISVIHPYHFLWNPMTIHPIYLNHG